MRGLVSKFDGQWKSRSGEVVRIEADTIFFDNGPGVKLTSVGQDEFSVELDGMGIFLARRDTAGHLQWSDGDIWVCQDAPPEVTAVTVEPKRAQAVPAAQRKREAMAEASRRRVASASDAWHHILGIKESARVEEIKQAYHELSLLHHPDKSSVDDGGATFKRVQAAYEEALRVREREVLELQRPQEEEVVPAAAGDNALQISVRATKKQLRSAMDRWERAMDDATATHIIDDIPSITVEEVFELLCAGKCLPVDVREEPEKYGKLIEPLPGALDISYMSLLKMPETVVATVAALQSRTKFGGDGRRIVCYSNAGGSSGACGGACCILADVFSIKDENLFTLEGGYLEWHYWRLKNREKVNSIPKPS